MERKSEFNFTIPRRQSYVAILIIIISIFRRIIKQLWPLLLVLLFNTKGSGSTSDRILLFLACMGILSGVLSIISFFKYYFYVDEDELIVERGILRKSRTSIPFDRIQTINFEQELVHRLFNVAKLKIDTAGSSGAELSLQALSWPMANSLKSYLLERRPHNVLNKQVNADDIVEENIDHQIMKVDFPSLIKIGATENHIRSGLLIIAFCFWIYDQLEEVGLRSYVNEMNVGWQTIASSVYTVFVLFLFFAILAFTYSLIRITLKYYDLKLVREKSGFRVSYGLLNRKQTSAQDAKIQTISWAQNWLQKKVGLFQVFLRQASSKEVRSGKSISVPGCDQKNVEEIQQYLLRHTDFIAEAEKTSVDKHFFWYVARNWTIAHLLVATFMIYTESWIQFTLASLFYLYFICTSWFKYKKKGYTLFNQVTAIYGGAYGAKHMVFENHKIQTIQLKQSWYQLRRNLASLEISTAGGVVVLPFIKKETAQKIMDYLLYRVETSNKAWM